MKEILEAVSGLVPVLQSSPVWVKSYFTVWLVATVALILCVIFTYHPNQARPDQRDSRVDPGNIIWPMTGDAQIDKTYASLNNLAKTASRTEAQLITALRNVFYKPVFQHIYEDSPEGALFTFCRAQLLLQAFVSEFGDPEVRRKIVDATQNLISLQDQLAQLYGPAFRRDQQCLVNGATAQGYISTMPPRQQNRLEGPQFSKAMSTLSVLRANLASVNLMDARP